MDSDSTKGVVAYFLNYKDRESSDKNNITYFIIR